MGPRNAVEALGGWQVGQELRQKQWAGSAIGGMAVGMWYGCGDVVWLCTDDIPYGGIMS